MHQGEIIDSDVITITMPSGEPEERTAARIQDMRSLEGATIVIGEHKRKVVAVGQMASWGSVALRLVALAVALLVFDCSIPDPGDMGALDAEIAKQPEGTRDKLKVGVVTTRLRDQRPGSQVIEVYCREDGGPWEGIYQAKGMVADIIMCLFLGGAYKECGEKLGAELVDIAKSSFANAGKSVECKWQWLPKFDPSKVTIDDTGTWLVGLPAPPPELLPEELAPLVPFLCPLTVWGCPPRPGDIGNASAASTGDFR